MCARVLSQRFGWRHRTSPAHGTRPQEPDSRIPSQQYRGAGGKGGSRRRVDDPYWREARRPGPEAGLGLTLIRLALITAPPGTGGAVSDPTSTPSRHFQSDYSLAPCCGLLLTCALRVRPRHTLHPAGADSTSVCVACPTGLYSTFAGALIRKIVDIYICQHIYILSTYIYMGCTALRGCTARSQVR